MRGDFDGMGDGEDMNDVLNDLFSQYFPDQNGRRRPSSGTSRFFGEQNSRQSTQVLEREINISLEDLFLGITKKISVKTDLVIDGRKYPVERTFEVKISRGWKSGTKIVFEQTKNFPVKVCFILVQTKHKFLERRGDDLYWKCLPIDKKKIKKGVIIRIPNVDGTEIVINTKNLSLKHGSKKVFTNLGMPISKKGSVIGRGDFIVKFQVNP